MDPVADDDAAEVSRLEHAPLADDLGFLLARASAVSQVAGNEALAEHDLKVRSYSVLALAVTGGRPSQRELAAFLRLDPSQVVALIDDLERRGLVTREPDPRDRRANVVAATLEGRKLYRRALADVEAGERRAHVGLSAADRLELTRLLRTVAFPLEG
ncbi:MAG: MarR family transcriptional regulator [Microbacterium enclense]